MVFLFCHETVLHVIGLSISIASNSCFYFYFFLQLKEKHEADASEKPAAVTSLAIARGLSLDYSKQMAFALSGVGTGVHDLLNKVLDVLDQGLSDISRSRDVVIDLSKQNIADISWIKVLSI